ITSWGDATPAPRRNGSPARTPGFSALAPGERAAPGLASVRPLDCKARGAQRGLDQAPKLGDLGTDSSGVGDEHDVHIGAGRKGARHNLIDVRTADALQGGHELL